jgi:hypothetical protein
VALGYVLMRDGHGPRAFDILARDRGLVPAERLRRATPEPERPQRRRRRTAERQNQTNPRKAAKSIS